MKCTGIFMQLFRDYARKKNLITLEVNEDIIQEYNQLKDKGKLSIEIKPYREKRSLDANSYFHVLVGKLADTLGYSKAYIKNLMLFKYGQDEYLNDKLVTFIIPDDADVSEREDMHLKPTSRTRVLDNGRLYRVCIVVRGSHTYDSKEMSVLISGTIDCCRDAGISDTRIISPQYKKELKERYGVDIG